MADSPQGGRGGWGWDGKQPTARWGSSPLQDGQSRTVRQFQFTDWPEQGVPKSGEGFIDFIGQVHKTKEQFGQDGPISVHCRCAAPRAPARFLAGETEASGG